MPDSRGKNILKETGRVNDDSRKLEDSSQLMFKKEKKKKNSPQSHTKFNPDVLLMGGAKSNVDGNRQLPAGQLIDRKSVV